MAVSQDAVYISGFRKVQKNTECFGGLTQEQAGAPALPPPVCASYTLYKLILQNMSPLQHTMNTMIKNSSLAIMKQSFT